MIYILQLFDRSTERSDIEVGTGKMTCGSDECFLRNKHEAQAGYESSCITDKPSTDVRIMS